MVQEKARIDQMRATGAALSDLTEKNYTARQIRETLDPGAQLLYRRIHWFTLEQADQLTTDELIAQRDSELAALALLVDDISVPNQHVAYMLARVEAFDEVMAERAWSQFEQVIEPPTVMKPRQYRFRTVAPQIVGGRVVA